MTVPPVWRALVNDLNGIHETRDPSAPCEAWEQTDEPNGSGDCMTDGHYRCVECSLISLVALRRKRDQCEDCGAALVFRNGLAHSGNCPNECDVPVDIIERRRAAERDTAVISITEYER